MRIVIDTNRYTDMANGVQAVVETLESCEATFVPIFVLAELRAGFVGGTRRTQNEAKLRAFLDQPPVQVLAADEGTTLHYAILFNQLRQQGTPIPPHDLWIAALTLQHGLTLYARDKHFDHIPQLMRL